MRRAVVVASFACGQLDPSTPPTNTTYTFAIHRFYFGDTARDTGYASYNAWKTFRRDVRRASARQLDTAVSSRWTLRRSATDVIRARAARLRQRFVWWCAGISLSLCGTAFDGMAAQFAAAADILKDGSNTPGVPCDGISFGIGFNAKLVANPTTIVDATPLGDPCAN